MEILIVGTDSQAVQQAAAVAREAQPQWDVSVCHDPTQALVQGGRGGPAVVVWDVELGSPTHLLTGAQDGPVVIVWGVPGRDEEMASALRSGASRCLVRHQGWEHFLPAMLEQATRSALTARSRIDEQRVVDVLGGVHEALVGALDEPVIVVNRGGLVVHINPAAEELTGLAADHALGSRLSSLIADASVAEMLVRFGSVSADAWSIPDDAPGSCEPWDGTGLLVRTALRHRDAGHLVDVQVRCRAVTTSGGERHGVVLLPRLVPASVRPPGGSTPGDVLAAALDVLPLPLVIATSDGTILRASPAFPRLANWGGPGRVGGKHLRQVLAYPDALLSLLQTAWDSQVPQVREEPLRPLVGDRVHCLVTAVPIPSADCPGCVAVTFEPTLEPSASSPSAPVAADGLDLLLRVVEGVDSAAGLSGVLDAMVAGLVQALPVDAVLVVAEDPVSGELVHSAHGLDQAARVPIAEALFDEVRRSYRAADSSPVPEHITDAHALDGAASLRALYVDQRVRSVCHVPVVVTDGGVVGGMVTCSRTPRGQDESLCALLSVAAGHLAHAICRERVHRLSARAAEFQDKLLAVSLALNAGNDIDQLLELIAHTALDIVGGDYCCVEVLDEDQQFEKSYAAARPDARGSALELRSSPLAWQAVQTAEIALAEAGPDGGGPAAGAVTIAVPLMLDFSAIGALSVRRGGGLSFDANETSGLRVLAAQASVAIHSTRLYEVARRRSQHMEVVAAQAWQEEGRARALFEVATAVTERTDLQEILAVVTRSACTEIGFERAQIYLADHENQTLVGRLEARADAGPEPMSETPVPLRRDSHNRLAEAALGSAPYMIDLVEDVSDRGVRHYERVFVPLVTQEMLVGLIVADNPVSGDPVSPHQTRLLRPLASLASVAIERARVEKLRGTIISSVSHELRAPLASIRAYNELVMAGDVGPVNQEQVTYLDRVDKACRHLERVIADLMNLSKLRSGEVSISLAPTDLTSVVYAVLDTLRPRAKQASVQLMFDDPGPLPETMTDHGRLEQVLTNLVDNAIKFNEPNGWVRLDVAIDGEQAIITVADNGPGIPRSQQSTVFEEFVHGTDEKSRAKDGAGLGLAIARRVIEVLGGRLSVDSEVGQGSTFYVALPMEPAEAPD